MSAVVPAAAEHQARRDLDEAEAAAGEVARIEAHIGHVIQGELEAAFMQRRDALVLDRADATQIRSG